MSSSETPCFLAVERISTPYYRIAKISFRSQTDADRAEREIGLPVQATVRSLDQWRRARESFITEVKRRPLVPVLVGEGHPDLGRELQALPAGPEETP